MWIKVSWIVFSDAMEIASRRGDRLRASDHDAMMLFFEKNQCDLSEIYTSIDGRYPSKIGMIARGLYRGIFRYDPEECYVYKWLSNNQKLKVPLEEFNEKAMLDVTISYSMNDQHLALPLGGQLRKEGLSVYLIDLSKAELDDPIWEVRFRESVFRSRYMLPLLTPSYLERYGSRAEMFDLARINVAHRSTEHFSPLLPYKPPLYSFDELRLAWAKHGKFAPKPDQFDPTEDGYQWIMEHVLPISSEWKPTEIAKFIRSLRDASIDLESKRSVQQFDFLRLLSDRVTSCELFEEGGAKIGFQHALAAWSDREYLFYFNPNGFMKYVGVQEIQKARGAQERFSQLMQRIDPTWHLKPSPKINAGNPNTSPHCSSGRILPAQQGFLFEDDIRWLGMDQQAERVLIGTENAVGVYSLMTGEPAFVKQMPNKRSEMLPSGKIIVEASRGFLLLDNQGKEVAASDLGFIERWGISDAGDKMVAYTARGISVFDTASLELVHRLEGEIRNPFDFAAPDDSSKLAIGAIDGIYVWPWDGVARRKVNADACYSLRFDQHGQQLAASYFDNQICVYDVASMNKINQLSVSGSAIRVRWLSAAEILVQHRATENGSVLSKVWNIDSGSVCQVGKPYPWRAVVAIASKARLVMVVEQGQLGLLQV